MSPAAPIMTNGGSLLIDVKSAQIDASTARKGARRERLFVECLFGAIVARTASALGPSCTFNQTFKLPLDGRTRKVTLTLKRERTGGKEPVSLGGISFDISPDFASATAVERDWRVGGSATLRAAFAADMPLAPPPPVSAPRPEAGLVQCWSALPGDGHGSEVPSPGRLPAWQEAEDEGLTCGPIRRWLGCLPAARAAPPAAPRREGPELRDLGAGISGFSPAERFVQPAALPGDEESTSWTQRWGIFDTCVRL